jgi:hypothetical protein
MNTNNYDWLISRLDAFIRKYYINQLIRGGLILLTCTLLYILLISVGEYYLYLPVWARTTLVSLFVICGLVALVRMVIIPITKIAKLGKTISHEQAATIIGAHFPEVSDKLLNILQLKNSVDIHSSAELAMASIDQKAQQIAVVPITMAINLSKNKRYLRFLLPVVLIGIIILLVSPRIFTDASERLLQPTKAFEKPAPFQYVIKTLPLRTVRNGDYTLQVTTTGAALPSNISLAIGDEHIPMNNIAAHTFQYTFKNVTEPVTFSFQAAGYTSHPYTLQVFQKPLLKAVKVQIDYPEYTGKKDEIKNSLGDMVLPVGTMVRWALLQSIRIRHLLSGKVVLA